MALLLMNYFRVRAHQYKERHFMTSHSIETIAIATANAMKKEGLDGFEDHPDKIITKAIKTYAIDDEDFQIRMTMVAEKMTEIIGKIYRETTPTSSG